MAATMRPQFGSCPATAVFTSGELAMAKATLWASASAGGAGDADLDQLGRAFAIADHLQGQVAHHAGSAVSNALAPGPSPRQP
jgi:hypothetical protein